MPSLMQASSQGSLTPIATFKLLKGVLLLLAGAGFLRWVDPEIETALSPLLDTLHLSLHTRLLHAATLHVQALQPHSLLMMGLISLTYATLLFVEGFGLWVEASWAAYLTVFSMSVLLPSELHAVAHEVSVTGLVIVAANVAIVGYLLYRLGMQTLR